VITELFDTMLAAADFPEGFRVGISCRGFRMGRGRQPLSPRQRTALGKLQKALQQRLEGLSLPYGGSNVV
jgi:hypothetical protein